MNCDDGRADFGSAERALRLNSRSSFPAVLLVVSLFLPQFAKPTISAEHELITEALARVRSAPRDAAEFDYVMTARVRLLFFWAGKDDVGGGYIRRGVAKDDPQVELLQVLFGSDPAKAPRAINRWGAGTELVRHKEAVTPGVSKSDDIVESVFFGFMKSSRGKSVSEMQEELKKEKEQGEHEFTGILSRVETGRAISLVTPLPSNVDYNLHQYEEAEPLMLERLKASERPVKSVENGDGCERAGEFLGTVAELLDAAIDNPKRPLSLCYVYDAQANKLVVEHAAPLAKLTVKVNTAKGAVLQERSYENLMETDFVSIHQKTGKRVYFTILAGTQGNLRGVPVQIRYQPNWWFQVVLNLLAKNGGEGS